MLGAAGGCGEASRLDGDMKDMELRPVMAMDREKWRCGIMGRTSDPHKRGNNRRYTSSSSSSRNILAKVTLNKNCKKLLCFLFNIYSNEKIYESNFF